MASIRAEQMSAVQKVAGLLITLGPSAASEIMKNIDLERAKAELYSIDESTRRGRVEKLFLQAKIDLVEGKNDEAREKLQKVVSLGGGLAITKEADELLENE
jgi:flagellar motor switch protein FliG